MSSSSVNVMLPKNDLDATFGDFREDKQEQSRGSYPEKTGSPKLLREIDIVHQELGSSSLNIPEW